MWILVIIVIILVHAVVVYVGLRVSSIRILGLYDRALRNARDHLDARYELPVYAQADLAARWSGWDGWYVLMLPREAGVPVKAIRTSIMTGLYGMDGIDNYEELREVPSFAAVEYLTLVHTQETSHLFHRYVPRRTDLAIRREQLLVSVKDWGEISGQWPEYRVRMRDPAEEMEVSLSCTARHLLWWADLPGLFTYVAAFGDFHGTVSLRGREHPVTGMGTFEHGFARAPFAYDRLLQPVRWVQKLHRFTLMHYHYNLLIGEDGWHGGIMLAQGVGIDFRKLGGIYLPDGRFVRLDHLEIVYAEMETIDPHPVPFPKRWVVWARAEGGTLEYTAIRESPAAVIASHMLYFDFRFTGTYREPGNGDSPLAGHGYGEYVRL